MLDTNQDSNDYKETLSNPLVSREIENCGTKVAAGGGLHQFLVIICIM